MRIVCTLHIYVPCLIYARGKPPSAIYVCTPPSAVSYHSLPNIFCHILILLLLSIKCMLLLCLLLSHAIVFLFIYIFFHFLFPYSYNYCYFFSLVFPVMMSFESKLLVAFVFHCGRELMYHGR